MAEPLINPKATGIVPGFLKYVGSFFEIFKSRTRTVAILGAVAYFVNKFTGYQIDTETAASILTGAAENPPLTTEDLIVLAVTAGVTYFHANQREKIVYTDKPADNAAAK